MIRLVVFGTGAVAKYFTTCLDFNKVEIVAFVNSKRKMEKIGGGRETTHYLQKMRYKDMRMIILSSLAARLKK